MELWGHGGLYGDWCDYLERWSSASGPLPDRPPALSPDDFDSPTWYRLMLRIQEAINARLTRWQDVLQRTLSAAADEFSWGRALVDARHGLRSILALTDLPELTEEVRSGLRRQVEAAITDAQSQLERNAQDELRRGNDRGAAEMCLRQLRQSPLTEALRTSSATSPLPSSDPFPALPDPVDAPRRRRILLD